MLKTSRCGKCNRIKIEPDEKKIILMYHALVDLQMHIMFIFAGFILGILLVIGSESYKGDLELYQLLVPPGLYFGWLAFQVFILRSLIQRYKREHPDEHIIELQQRIEKLKNESSGGLPGEKGNMPKKEGPA